jgi:hypothetical protein
MKNPTFTKRELAMMVQAVSRYEDVSYNEDGKKGNENLRKAVYKIFAKADAMGIPVFNEENYLY